MADLTATEYHSLDYDIQNLISQDHLCANALDYVTPILPQAVLNHSLRVYLYAKNLLTHSLDYPDPSIPSFPVLSNNSDWPPPRLLFIASLFHDFGASSACNHKPFRFEVCGADAAASFLLSSTNVVSPEDAHRVWAAIALHTSPHIAERIDPFSRVMRLGPLMDFVEERRTKFGIDENWVEELEYKLPRLGIEKCLSDTVVVQAVQEPLKAPKGSWPGNLIRAHRDREAGKGEEWMHGVNPEF